MYQYQIFPFVVYEQQPLEGLPVEMSSNILRYLDGASLLNAANSSKKLMAICRGDPLLRRTLRFQLKKEQELRRQFLLDPSRSVTVTRTQKGTVFQRNVVKDLKKNKQPFEALWSTKKTGGGKLKTATVAVKSAP